MSDSPDIPSSRPAPIEGADVTRGALQILEEKPREELDHIAEDIGLDSSQYRTPRRLAPAIQERREMINAMDREAMLEAARWGRRPIPPNPTKEQLALEISQIKSMRFTGLPLRGLIVLAVMRGVPLKGDETEPELVRKLKKQEGFFRKIARKRRAWMGSIISGMLGEQEFRTDEQFAAPQEPGLGTTNDPTLPPLTEGSLKDEIEEAGV